MLTVKLLLTSLMTCKSLGYVLCAMTPVCFRKKLPKLRVSLPQEAQWNLFLDKLSLASVTVLNFGLNPSMPFSRVNFKSTSFLFIPAFWNPIIVSACSCCTWANSVFEQVQFLGWHSDDDACFAVNVQNCKWSHVLPQLGSHSPVPQLPFCSICHSTFQGVIWEQWAFRRGLGTLVGGAGAGDTCLSTYAVIQPFGV